MVLFLINAKQAKTKEELRCPKKHLQQRSTKSGAHAPRSDQTARQREWLPQLGSTTNMLSSGVFKHQTCAIRVIIKTSRIHGSRSKVMDFGSGSPETVVSLDAVATQTQNSNFKPNESHKSYVASKHWEMQLRALNLKTLNPKPILSALTWTHYIFNPTSLYPQVS